MLGLSSLNEIEEFVESRLGRAAATGVSYLLIAGIVGIAIGGVTIGLASLRPLGTGTVSLLSGAAPLVPVGDWLPSLLSVFGIAGVVIYLKRVTRRLHRWQRFTEEWLNGPLEKRLKALLDRAERLERTAVSVDWATEHRESVLKDASEIRADLKALSERVLALESHTDISGLRALLAQRYLDQDKRRKQASATKSPVDYLGQPPPSLPKIDGA